MVKSLSTNTKDRKKIIADLISDGKIHSQADVVRELAILGLVVTQATASRDLQELGAIRAKGEAGESRYILQSNSLSTANASLILNIASSGNSVVIKTPPAAAQFIASSLDKAISTGELGAAIGTIAGDDTVLVIASTADGGLELSKKVSSIFGKGK